MSTLLSELVRKQVSLGLIGVFSKTIDRVVEDMVNDVLRSDPAYRKQLEDLVRAALAKALKELNEPPAPELPSPRLQQLDRIEHLMREQKK